MKDQKSMERVLRAPGSRGVYSAALNNSPLGDRPTRPLQSWGEGSEYERGRMTRVERGLRLQVS